MSRLFDPENKFWNFIGKIADVTCMSFLWVGTSLPLVTMGAATTAFYSYTMHQVRDTEGGILSGYFKAFRHNFKKATLLWLLEVAGLAFFAADLVGVWNLFLFLGGLPAILVGALVLCLAFLFLGCTFYIWPLLAVFEFPLKKLLTNSFVMAVGNLPVTLTLALVWALAGVGCFYLSGVFFVWVGLAIFASSYFVDMVFKKYTGELAEEEAAWKQKQEERRQRRKLQKNKMLRPMTAKQRAGYILHYYRFWFIGLALLLLVGFYVGDAVIQSHKEILLQGFFTNDEYNLFPAERIEKDYAATQTLTRQQRVVFDDALYIDLGGEASEYTAASNGKLTAYMMMHELDFVVTSDEVLEYYKDTFPMEDLEALLPADLREALADKLFFNTDADGKTTAIALDMTQSRFVAGTGADADPNVQHTYYFFVPAGAPHPEQIVQFLRYSFGM